MTRRCAQYASWDKDSVRLALCRWQNRLPQTRRFFPVQGLPQRVLGLTPRSATVCWLMRTSARSRWRAKRVMTTTTRCYICGMIIIYQERNSPGDKLRAWRVLTQKAHPRLHGNQRRVPGRLPHHHQLLQIRVVVAARSRSVWAAFPPARLVTAHLRLPQ